MLEKSVRNEQMRRLEVARTPFVGRAHDFHRIEFSASVLFGVDRRSMLHRYSCLPPDIPACRRPGVPLEMLQPATNSDKLTRRNLLEIGYSSALATGLAAL